MGVNVEMLKEKIKASSYDMTQIAAAAGMDRSTMYRKIKADGIKFTIEEIQKLTAALGLSDEEAKAIFFTNRVA